MSFIEETFSAAKDLFETAQRKTGNTIEIEKLKIKAISVDKEIDKLYQEVGKSFYAKYKKGEEMPESLLGVFEKIDQKQQELEEIKDSIIEIKGGVVCNECGKVNLEGAVYCSNCGSHL